ncbi:MAG: D-tyrosyl-tRNA(Tyr) deacylase [Ruminiclostridium sp.]|nr:D-tyrosyl-tRNA(Tyr) deacylase [Ruminiclostridium sp.]
MRAVVQRAAKAKVSVEGLITGEIGRGLVVLLGIGLEDNDRDIEYLADKIVNLRIFEDNNGKMNISLLDMGGQLLVVSQFTLFGDCRKGKRPSYDRVARPEAAEVLYQRFVERCRKLGVKTETGRFQAMMQVELQNDGPVTLLLDSRKEF